MAAKQITLTGAYGMWMLALLTGIFGLPRFYLRQHVLGIAISAPFLIGIFLFLQEYISFLTGTLSSATAILGGSTDYAQLDNLQQSVSGLLEQRVAFVLMGIGLFVFFLELVLLPGACRKYQQQHKKYEHMTDHVLMSKLEDQLAEANREDPPKL